MYFLANARVCVSQYDEEGEEADDEVRLRATAHVWKWLSTTYNTHGFSVVVDTAEETL